MFTYSGWNAAGYIAEEIRNPDRNVPRAFALGTAAVIVIYLSLNLLYLYVLPVGELAKVQGSVLDVIADRLLGARAGDIMGDRVDYQPGGEHQRDDLRGPRVYYAMARDGLFFDAAARIHPKFKTPAAAIIAQSIWASLLVLSGSADALTNYTGFAIVAVRRHRGDVALRASRRASQMRRVRSRRSAIPSHRRCSSIACFLIVVNAIYSSPGPTGAGLLVMAAGIPLYMWLTRRRR